MQATADIVADEIFKKMFFYAITFKLKPALQL